MSFYILYDKIVREGFFEAKAEGPSLGGTNTIDMIVSAAQKTKDPEVYASLETFLKSYNLLGKSLRGYWHGRWERAGSQNPNYYATPGVDGGDLDAAMPTRRERLGRSSEENG